jgi:uracil-DNA glycosylase family 4
MKCDCLLKNRIEVPYSGKRDSDIAFVGESPGATEEQVGKPFQGDSGKLLKRLVLEVGLQWSAFAVFNSARCLIDKKELSAPEIRKILEACRPRLKRSILKTQPKLLILLGDLAIQQITGRKGVGKNRGRWFWLEEFNCWALATYHPSWVLRGNPEYYLKQDLCMVVDFIKSGMKPPKQEDLDYQKVKSIRELLKRADKGEKIIASVDSETTGLNFLDKGVIPICYSLSFDKAQGWTVPLYREAESGKIPVKVKRPKPGTKKPIEQIVWMNPIGNIERKKRELKAFLEHPNIKKVTMNGNFDFHIFEEFIGDFDLQGYIMDVQAAAHVINENDYKQASLETLQTLFTDFRSDYSQDFKENHSYFDMPSVPMKALSYYANGDSDTTRRVATTLIDLLNKPAYQRQKNYYQKLVHPVLYHVLLTLERNGSKVDMKSLPKVKVASAEMLESLAKKMTKLTPVKVREKHAEKFTWTRGDLIADVLFSKQGYNLKSTNKTAKGKNALDKNSRKALLDNSRLPEKAREFLKLLDAWKEQHTFYTRYLTGFEKAVQADGRIHSRYSIVNAVTGRIASSEPNLMNIPKRSAQAGLIRQLICAPKGKVLLAVDASQAELRFAAHLSQDKNMLRIFRNGLDMHRETAEHIKGKKKEEMTEAEFKKARQDAKPANFGLLYLMSPKGFQEYAKNDYGVIMSLEQAEQYIEKWFALYPGLRKYHAKTIKFCEEYGYVESPLGRRRHLPEIHSDSMGIRNYARRQAVNHPIQSASSDTVLLATAEIQKKKLLNPDEIKLVNFIHDEVVYEVDDNSSVIERNYKTIKNAMEHPPLHRFGVELSIPLVSDGKIGKNLASMQEIS